MITQNALCEVRNMKNPFQYGDVVGGDAFCNRRKEVGDLLRAMENGEKLFVYSERRFGKTSLVRFALDKLPKKQYEKDFGVRSWNVNYVVIPKKVGAAFCKSNLRYEGLKKSQTNKKE